jgi:hypothetical protein
MMLSYIPGGRRIKKYILRLLGGIFLLPVGPIALLWNEHQAILEISIIQDQPNYWIYWVIRLAATAWITICFYRILSAVKLFMSKIPLTYEEIRNGIFVSSIMLSLMISLISISIARIYYQPMISLILGGAAMALIIAFMIRKMGKIKINKAKQASVQPHQAKDT